MIRALIVDDEPLARALIRKRLGEWSAVEVVGEAADAPTMRNALQQLAPDLLFLDVELSNGSAFEILENLATAPPAIVFTTAHEQYAVWAFDHNAADYLVKPFTRQRFHHAMQRALARIQADASAEIAARVSAPRQPVGLAAARQDERDFLTVRGSRPGSYQIVRTKDILWVEAADNYVRLHTAHKTHLQRGTLRALEQCLDETRFVRTHRRALVNIGAIRSVSRDGARMVLQLSGGQSVPVGGVYRDRIASLLRSASATRTEH